ncbi:MAG: hypothetical protein CME62_09205 [Halobacteriovoraceae bacterium]|nr:hypothetical protein [Halobacteriovoraceae bacterium]|tara:strand:- start:14487 stop:15812 length:1326 start_codon:yes stop_codon:yes gene_type:complete
MTKEILRNSAPLAISLFAIMSFNLVDSLFLAHISKEKLAAISLILPLTVVFGGFNFGMSAAVSSIVSRYNGAKDFNGINTVIWISLALNFMISLVLILLVSYLSQYIASFLNVPKDALVDFYDYLSIWKWAIPFIGIPVLLNSSLKALGRTYSPAIIIILTSVINLILDYLFIIKFETFTTNAMTSAALATLLARVFMSVTLVFYSIKIRSLNFSRLLNRSYHFIEIVRMSVPNIIIGLMVPAITTYTTSYIGRFGIEVVAHFGAIARIESVLAILGLALTSGSGPILGKFFGEGNEKKIMVLKSTLKKFLVGSFLFLTITSLISSNYLHSLFFDKSSSNFILYLLIMNIYLFSRNLFALECTHRNSIGKPRKSLNYNIAGSFIYLITLKYIDYLNYDPILSVYYAMLFTNLCLLFGIYVVSNIKFKDRELSALKIRIKKD